MGHFLLSFGRKVGNFHLCFKPYRVVKLGSLGRFYSRDYKTKTSSWKICGEVVTVDWKKYGVYELKVLCRSKGCIIFVEYVFMSFPRPDL